MISFLLLLVGLIAFSIVVGSWGCPLGACIAISFPLLIIVSIIISLISIVLLSKRYKFKWVLLFLVPVYVTVSIVTGYASMFYFHLSNISEDIAKESETARQQRFDLVRPGSIKRVANNLVYECKICGYRLTFPDNWGFEDSLYGFKSNDNGQEFILVTSDFSERTTFPFTSVQYRGQIFHIKSNQYTAEFEAVQKTYPNTLSEITINDIKGQLLKAYKGKGVIPQNEVIIKFSSQSHNFEISAGYEDESELNKNLKIILDNFEFI